jgi:hypothetical protein
MSASTSQALDYLEQLPGATHKKLYQQPSTALAVFRCMLPHLGKYMSEGLPAELFINALFYSSENYRNGYALYDWAISSQRFGRLDTTRC